jgi:CubicO group peptidase (beta-lactamase class C family)
VVSSLAAGGCFSAPSFPSPASVALVLAAGTLICIDPTNNVSLVLLTNRVYPNKTGNMGAIQTARQDFANAVLAAMQQA